MEIEYGYGSPRWTGEIADCSLPVTIDTYSNCSYGCVYCFSQYQRGITGGSDNYFRKKVKAVNPKRIERLFTEKEHNEFWDYIKTGRPIQYGGLSDQFDEFERKYGVTYEILKFLRKINYPICFSTKASWVFHDEKYRELFKGADNWNVKFSIITLDEKLSKKIEPGVPSPQDRLDAMKEYTSLNKGGATLRLRPFIIGVSEKTYLDLIKKAKDAGASAVTTEFFCLEMRSINIAKKHYAVISECCGFDVVDFYRKYSNGSGYLRLNRKVKEKYVREMRDLCHKLGMRFYVSDSHFKECSDNCCCCALPPEWDYSRGHFNGALQIAKETGSVRWSDIEKDMYFMKNVPCKTVVHFSKAEARAQFTGMSIVDYMRFLWNSPRRGQSPYKIFEKILIPDGIDENGDIIYRYNQDVTFEKGMNKKGFELEKL